MEHIQPPRGTYDADDAELGLGGIIIKLKADAHKVFMVDLTSGEPTPFGNEKKRVIESQKAAGILRVDERINLGLSNRYLSDTNPARLLLAEKIRIFSPDVIFCPYPEDVHPDHIAATKIVEAARFYAKYTGVKLKGKPYYACHLFYYFCTHLRIIPRVSFVVDISDFFKEKMKAIRCYRSQFISNPKNRFVFDYIKTVNRYLGSLVRTRYAEAIYSREVIKAGDLSGLI